MTFKTPALAEEAIDPDEAAVATAFVEFLKATSTKHHPTGTVPRFNQGRAAGCVEAEFIVPDGLPQDLRVGLFAHPRSYKARIRFAHASSESDTERDVRGMSIKVVRRGWREPDSGRVGPRLHPEQSPRDDGGAHQGLSRLAQGGGGGRCRARTVLRHTSARRGRGAGLAAACHESPRDSLLEHDTVPLRAGPGGQIQRASRIASKDAAAGPVDRRLPAGAPGRASCAGRSAFRVSRAVSDRRPEDADRRRERGMEARTTPRSARSPKFASPSKRSKVRAPRLASSFRSIPGTPWRITARSATSTARAVKSIARWRRFVDARAESEEIGSLPCVKRSSSASTTTHRFRGLYGCVNDARAVKKALERNGDGELNFTAHLVTAESDADAISRSTLKDLVRDLFAEDHEVALLYFAGHGHVELTGGYLCSSECRRGDDGLSLAEVMTFVNKSPAKNKVIFLDSCHSGIAGTPAGQKVAEVAEGVTILTASTREAVRDREEWQRRVHVATRRCLERRRMRPGRRQLRRAPCMRTSISRSVRGSSGRCSRRT